MSVALAGQTTSPEPPPLEIVTVTSFHTFVAVTPEPTKLKEETALVMVVPSSFTGIFALAVIVKSPLPRIELLLIVLMFVHDTSVSCFVSTLSYTAFFVGTSVDPFHPAP